MSETSSLTSLTGNEVRAFQKPGKMLIVGSYADEWFYPFWQYVTPEAKRKDYTLFLRTTGLINIIYKLIISLRDMSIRPPPEDAIEFLLKIMGKKPATKDGLASLKDERDNIRARMKNLTIEGKELRLRLENYEAIVTPYEILEPDDFAHLAPSTTGRHDPIFGKKLELTNSKEPESTNPEVSESHSQVHDPTVIQDETETTQQAKRVSLLATDPVAHLSEETHKQPMSSGSDEGATTTTKSVHLNDKKPALGIDDKYAATTDPTLADLDIDRLSEYLVSLGAVHPPDAFEEDLKKSKKSSKKKTVCGSGTLPKLEIPEISGFDVHGSDNMKLPPLILNQQLKYDDLINVQPPKVPTDTIQTVQPA